jgi:hypothetical protein
MATIAFDTLKLARRLEAAGFGRDQAADTAQALAETIGEAVVTRDYLDQRLGVTEANLDQRLAVAEAGLDRRLGVAEANLKAAIAESRSELLKWVIGLLLGQTAIIAALVKLL